MTDRGDNVPPPPDWHAEPRPWCPECCVPAKVCGCPTGERAYLDALEAHITRGTE